MSDWILPTEVTLTRSWVTLGISALLLSGYLVLAGKWFIQSRLTEQSKAKATAIRLIGILVAGEIMGPRSMRSRWRRWCGPSTTSCSAA